MAADNDNDDGDDSGKDDGEEVAYEPRTLEVKETRQSPEGLAQVKAGKAYGEAVIAGALGAYHPIPFAPCF